MSKILIIFSIGYENIAEMAEEITKGAKEVLGTAIFH
jgi:hypothetical protein